MSYNAEQLNRFVGEGTGPVIVDVRSKREFRQSHIAGAIHLPFWLVTFRYKILEPHRNKEIVVYCEHGPRAVLARQSLLSKGFSNVKCLEGHMQAWRRSGFPLINK